MDSVGPEPPAILDLDQMVEARNWVERLFTHVDSSFVITSLYEPCYNCIAYVLDDQDNIWWPSEADSRWPDDIELTEHVSSFIEMLRTHRYEKCENGAIEYGNDKIALFTRDGFVKHAARQLANGRWSSKLGAGYDISHATLTEIEGKRYGNATHFFRRRHEDSVTSS